MPFLRLKSQNGEIIELRLEAARVIFVLRDMIDLCGVPDEEDDTQWPVIALPMVRTISLRAIVEWAEASINDEIEDWNRFQTEFIQRYDHVAIRLLRDADYLHVESLWTVLCPLLAKRAMKFDVQDIRRAFMIPLPQDNRPESATRRLVASPRVRAITDNTNGRDMRPRPSSSNADHSVQSSSTWFNMTNRPSTSLPSAMTGGGAMHGQLGAASAVQVVGGLGGVGGVGGLGGLGGLGGFGGLEGLGGMDLLNGGLNGFDGLEILNGMGDMAGLVGLGPPMLANEPQNNQQQLAIAEPGMMEPDVGAIGGMGDMGDLGNFGNLINIAGMNNFGPLAIDDHGALALPEDPQQMAVDAFDNFQGEVGGGENGGVFGQLPQGEIAGQAYPMDHDQEPENGDMAQALVPHALLPPPPPPPPPPAPPLPLQVQLPQQLPDPGQNGRGVVDADVFIGNVAYWAQVALNNAWFHAAQGPNVNAGDQEPIAPPDGSHAHGPIAQHIGDGHGDQAAAHPHVPFQHILGDELMAMGANDPMDLAPGPQIHIAPLNVNVGRVSQGGAHAGQGDAVGDFDYDDDDDDDIDDDDDAPPIRFNRMQFAQYSYAIQQQAAAGIAGGPLVIPVPGYNANNNNNIYYNHAPGANGGGLVMVQPQYQQEQQQEQHEAAEQANGGNLMEGINAAPAPEPAPAPAQAPEPAQAPLLALPLPLALPSPPAPTPTPPPTPGEMSESADDNGSEYQSDYDGDSEVEFYPGDDIDDVNIGGHQFGAHQQAPGSVQSVFEVDDYIVAFPQVHEDDIDEDSFDEDEAHEANNNDHDNDNNDDGNGNENGNGNGNENENGNGNENGNENQNQNENNNNDADELVSAMYVNFENNNN